MAECVGEHGITDAELHALGPKLALAADAVEKGALGFRKLPHDTKLADEIVTSPVKSRRAAIISSSSASAVPRSATSPCTARLNHPEYNHLARPPRRGPRLFVPDNVDPDRIAALLEVVDLDNTVFNVITKSGGTAETMSEFLVFRDALIKKLGPEKHVERIVITTDPRSGRPARDREAFPLRVPADPTRCGRAFLRPQRRRPAQRGGHRHRHPQTASRRGRNGRTLPEIEEALGKSRPHGRGAALFDGQGERQEHPGDDAVFARVARRGGLVPSTLGREPRQTLDRAGKRVHTGQTPEKALGVTDQHSVMQLYIEGPFDKVVTFLAVDGFHANVPIPPAFPQFGAVNYLGGHTLNELIAVEQRASELALTLNGRPNCAIRLHHVDEESVGALLYLLEMQTAYAGQLYNINAFDQPGVELGKNFAYGLMGRKGYESMRGEIQQSGKPNPKWVVNA